jgi:hypothetical protein
VAFDVSVCEIWGALLGGGASESVARSPEDFHPLLVTGTRQCLKSDPVGVYALQTADALSPELGRQLKLETVVFGGGRKALSPSPMGERVQPAVGRGVGALPGRAHQRGRRGDEQN